ncbi:hypothetical protein [Streptomyces sp. NPDC048637]|uniref:hypothetical protein n=1 Tax=Streptomyces sp. NPDC048637 TaxID=3155636 RepID=UPI00341B726E
MEFQVTITPPSRRYDLAADIDPSLDYESLIMEACEILAETDSEFHVAGFGQHEWPVSVSYDLSTFMEQLPQAIASLRTGSTAEIDFYGQGLERVVSLSPRGEEVAIRCTSRTGWQPTLEIEQVSYVAAVRMLTGAFRDFRTALDLASPGVATFLPVLDD